MNRNKNRKALQTKIDQHYDGREKRIIKIGLTCIDCVRGSCLMSCDNKNRIVLNKKDNDIVHRILRNAFKLLEEQSLRFHEAIKEILEQIVFHREQIGVQERDIYIPKIQNFQERMKEFNREYKRMLREPLSTKLL